MMLLVFIFVFPFVVLCRLISPTLSIVWKNGNGLRGLGSRNRVRAMSQGMAEIEERRGNAWVSVEKRGN